MNGLFPSVVTLRKINPRTCCTYKSSLDVLVPANNDVEYEKPNINLEL